MSFVVFVECFGRFIVRVVYFFCCVVGVVRSFFYKCKWRYGLIVEGEESFFYIIKYFGFFIFIFFNDIVLYNDVGV